MRWSQMTSTSKMFTEAEAKKIGDTLHIDWGKVDFHEFAMGVNVELETLNRRFILTFEGTYPPVPNDWYWVSWSTSYNTTFAAPYISMRFLKKNGKAVSLEMSFSSALQVFSHSLR